MDKSLKATIFPFDDGAKAVSAGMNPMDLKRGIDKAVIALVDELKKRSKKVTTPAETAQVGAIAANGEMEIGKMIAEANAEGRQRRRDHGRGSQGDPNRARRGLRHAVRSRLHVALLHHQRRE